MPRACCPLATIWGFPIPVEFFYHQARLARQRRSRLIVEKELAGFADRDDIQTYVDLRDAEGLSHADL